LLAANPTAFAQSSTPYRLDKITDGVYLAVPRAPGPDAANIPVLVSDRDVMLVGTHLFPADAQALVQQVKTVTDKSVRYIVNTHYHAASTAAGEAFPAGIEVIGHELARKTLLTDGAGKPRPAGSTVAPPTVGMTTRLALYRGEREIRILFVGRGHSDNDLVVLLPRERIICTGDLLVAGVPDMSAGNITEWISTLESLKLQDFDTVLPARGAPFNGKQKIDMLQSYLRDLLSQTTELLNKGLSVEEAARRVDLTGHAKDYPEITRPGVDVNAVRRLKTQIEDPPPPF
jgi:glyoxylase-like metal-dependent hydrolase (beta-lactamase superfamily II)